MNDDLISVSSYLATSTNNESETEIKLNITYIGMYPIIEWILVTCGNFEDFFYKIFKQKNIKDRYTIQKGKKKIFNLYLTLYNFKKQKKTFKKIKYLYLLKLKNS